MPRHVLDIREEAHAFRLNAYEKGFAMRITAIATLILVMTLLAK